MDYTPKILYGDVRLESIKDCIICQAEFKEDDLMTPLPCHTSHCYHHQCITSWFGTKVECPQCRHPFTPEEMRDQYDNMNQVLDRFHAE